MRRRNRIVFAAFLPAALVALSAGSAAADCAAVDAKIRAALSASDTAAYPALQAEMIAETSCDAAYRDSVGRAMARSVLTTLPTDSQPSAIEVALGYGRPWQVLVALGDSHYDRNDWGNAVAIYEEALDDMRDVVANPNPPPEDVERRVYSRAVEARALAPTFTATRSFRGKKTGLADPNFRNFTAEAVPVPVRFEYDSHVLTEEGIAAVTDIYAYVSVSAPDHLTIYGHTDPIGSDSYNQGLSERRAESVAAYLTQLGYKGKIEYYGKGESEPFTPDDPAKYSQEQLYAFDRRVEYAVE